MSRIERYQESINKFIKSKDIFTEDVKNNLLKRDHLCGIIFATLLNHNSKKTNFKVHGYYMSTAIDLLYHLIIKQNQKNQDNITSNNILNLVNTVYSLFQLNIESLKVPAKQENNNIKLIILTFYS